MAETSRSREPAPVSGESEPADPQLAVGYPTVNYNARHPQGTYRDDLTLTIVAHGALDAEGGG